MLTLLFWVILDKTGWDLWSFDNLGIHLMPFVLLLIDFSLNSHQFPISHFLFIVLPASGIYMILNKIHACTIGPLYGIDACSNIWPFGLGFMMLVITHLIGSLTWKKWRKHKINKKLRPEDNSSFV